MQNSTTLNLAGIAELKPMRAGVIKVAHLVMAQLLPLTVYYVSNDSITFESVPFRDLAQRLKLPASYSIEGVYLDSSAMVWCVLVRSEELPEVPATKQVPTLHLIYERNGETGEIGLRSIQVEGK